MELEGEQWIPDVVDHHLEGFVLQLALSPYISSINKLRAELQCKFCNGNILDPAVQGELQQGDDGAGD